jgi:hypothetical protein
MLNGRRRCLPRVERRTAAFSMHPPVSDRSASGQDLPFSHFALPATNVAEESGSRIVIIGICVDIARRKP